MNKQEILEFINYKGKYNKEVKTKLNKLIKKYHPDKNKNDKETILILYEVKKELEEGKKLEYNEESIKSEEKIERTNPFFIERIIILVDPCPGLKNDAFLYTVFIYFILHVYIFLHGVI